MSQATALPEGWLVTDCARCGDQPVLTPVDDPNNNELRVCHRCEAHLATCENCGAKGSSKAKTYAVEVQVAQVVHVFPEATSPEEAAAMAKEQWAELTRFSGDDVPPSFDEVTMTITRTRELD